MIRRLLIYYFLQNRSYSCTRGSLRAISKDIPVYLQAFSSQEGYGGLGYEPEYVKILVNIMKK